MASSNGNIFSVTGVRNSPVTGEFPSQRPVRRSFDVFFDQCLNRRLSKQSWGWWFEIPTWSLWRHCNVYALQQYMCYIPYHAVVYIYIYVCVYVCKVNFTYSIYYSGAACNAYLFNTLWPSDAIWQHRSGSTMIQVMACCLTAPSHYLNQCWIISKAQWHSSLEGNFTRDTSGINH